MKCFKGPQKYRKGSSVYSPILSVCKSTSSQLQDQGVKTKPPWRSSISAPMYCFREVIGRAHEMTYFIYCLASIVQLAEYSVSYSSVS